LTGRLMSAPLNPLHPSFFPPVARAASVATVVPAQEARGGTTAYAFSFSNPGGGGFDGSGGNGGRGYSVPGMPPVYQFVPFGGGQGGSSYGDSAASLQGGSGGGSYGTHGGMGYGGGGGGAIEIGAIGRISVGGSISANGSSGSEGGGGGSGGGIFLHGNSVTLSSSGVLSAQGGNGSDVGGGGGGGRPGTAVNIFETARNRWENREISRSDDCTMNSFGA
jgi:hypothetical protein